MLFERVVQLSAPPAEIAPVSDLRQQYAALCYRMVKGRPEVLLVTSRDTGRWILPKGWPMAGISPAAAAAREAFEEAGVQGQVGPDSIGQYSYTKMQTDRDGWPCRVAVYPLRVRRLLNDFPEKGQRRRRWLNPKKAALRVMEPELQALLAGFMARRPATGKLRSHAAQKGKTPQQKPHDATSGQRLHIGQDSFRGPAVAPQMPADARPGADAVVHQTLPLAAELAIAERADISAVAGSA